MLIIPLFSWLSSYSSSCSFSGFFFASGFPCWPSFAACDTTDYNSDADQMINHIKTALCCTLSCAYSRIKSSIMMHLKLNNICTMCYLVFTQYLLSECCLCSVAKLFICTTVIIRFSKFFIQMKSICLI